MAALAQFIAAGIGMGSVYALIAVGFSLIYKVTGVINFAQGEFAMIGAMAFWMLQSHGLPLVPALVLSVAIAAAVGAAIGRFVMYPAAHASVLTLIFITLGLDTALRGLGMLAWGVNPVAVQPFSGNGVVRLLGAVVPVQNLWIFGAVLLVAALLYLLLERTYLGRGMTAAMDNPTAARLYGMDPLRFGLYAWVLAGAIGAFGGVVFAPMTTASVNMGLDLGLYGFVGAILGGFDSLPGAAIGGIFLGVITGLASGYVSSDWADGVAFLVLLVVLLLRPQGLLGTSLNRRV